MTENDQSSNNPEDCQSEPKWFIVSIRQASRPSGRDGTISIPSYLCEADFRMEIKRALRNYYADAIKGILKNYR